jgi:DNA-binding NarL/FixJ family response regulator
VQSPLERSAVTELLSGAPGLEVVSGDETFELVVADRAVRYGVPTVVVDLSSDPSAARRLLTAVRQHRGTGPVATLRSPPDRTSRATLTPREGEVLVRLAQGLRAPQIAEDLGISVRAVNDRKRRIYRKLGASNETGAVAEAARRGELSDL